MYGLGRANKIEVVCSYCGKRSNRTVAMRRYGQWVNLCSKCANSAARQDRKGRVSK
jgi:hypothetical protein